MWYQTTDIEEIRYGNDQVIIWVTPESPDLMRSKVTTIGETKLIIEEECRNRENE